MTRAPRPPLIKAQHLLAIDDISSLEAIRLLDLADRYVGVSRQTDKREPVLQPICHCAFSLAAPR